VSDDAPAIDVLAATFGLDATGAEVVRAATRHVVRFPASQVRTFATTHQDREEAAIAALLADAGVPAARLLAGPAPIDGWWVTAWREIPGVQEQTADPATLGAVAARLHRATGGIDPRGVIACDPIGAGLAQLEIAIAVGRTGDDELAILRRAATRLEPVWEAACASDSAVVHGDLHAGNVVIGSRGPVLVDLELAGWGPVAYDAAPTVAFVRWYDRPDTDAAAFDEAYGAPITADAHDLAEVWALWSTCWCVANRHRSPELEAEARTRIATVATGEAPAPWQLR
jgi:aminoglycoside phosphotransferase (APT) family kinase protein